MIDVKPKRRLSGESFLANGTLVRFDSLVVDLEVNLQHVLAGVLHGALVTLMLGSILCVSGDLVLAKAWKIER